MKKLWLLLLPFAFMACQQANESHLYMLKQTDSLLQANIDLVNGKAFQSLKSLDYKTIDPCTKFNSTEWFQKAKSIDSITSQFTKVLIGIRDSFAILIHYPSTKTLNEKVSNYSFLAEHQVQQRLESAFKAYQREILLVDSSISTEFKKSILSIDTFYYNLLNKSDGFKNISSINFILLLRQVHNSIVSLRLNSIDFCNRKIANDCDMFYEKFTVISSVSTETARPNEKVSIYAGLGEFNIKANPIIEIAGRRIKLNDDGVAIYHIKAPEDTGKYSVPVKISFKNPNTGQIQIVEREVSYTVKE